MEYYAAVEKNEGAIQELISKECQVKKVQMQWGAYNKLPFL